MPVLRKVHAYIMGYAMSELHYDIGNWLVVNLRVFFFQEHCVDSSLDKS